MRAFLSHSSKNKPFVEAVARELRPGTYELDQTTFEFGVLNHQAILDALERSDIFALFVSADSISSKIVKYEASIAQELFARGAMGKLLFFCIDKTSFNEIDPSWKSFNFVRQVSSPKIAAHQLLTALIEVRATKGGINSHFVGRSKELEAAKNRIIDPDQPAPKAILVSGNRGIGRRTFARHLYKETFPSVNTVMPEFPIAKFDGYDEIYRKLSAYYMPSRSVSETLRAFIEFEEATETGKRDSIVSILKDAQGAREVVVFRDDGGIFDDKGALQSVLQQTVSCLPTHPHPCVVIIAERTPPLSQRRANTEIAYVPLGSLSETSVRQLLALKLRGAGIDYSGNQLDRLVELSDGHPFNVNYVVESVAQYGLDAFVANPSDLIMWKNRRTAEYIESLGFTDAESRVLGVLRQFPSLDFSILAEAAALAEAVTAEALAGLIDKHVIEVSASAYYISPPIRGAVERSHRFDLRSSIMKSALKRIAESFVSIDESRTISASFVDAGILALLQSDAELPPHFSAFLLPSHLVWLARRHYDSRRFSDALRLSEQALDGLGRMSPDGKIEACRLLCLCAARLDETAKFERGLSALKGLPRDDFVRSNIEFLLGFKARLDGNLPAAETHQLESSRLRPGFFASARELASIFLARGNLMEAERFARQAYDIAPDNPYVLDVLTSILIRLMSKGKPELSDEIDGLLEKLQPNSQDDSSSFYETRRAEYELAQRNFPLAEKYIDEALRKTPNIFGVHALRAKIGVERGNATVVSDALTKMNSLVRRSQSEGRRNIREFLDIRSSYYVMTHNFTAARKIYEVAGVYDKDEISSGLRAIDIAESYAKT